METPGGFYEVEKDGKLLLAYHHPLFDPKPQTESLTSSAEATTHEHLHEVLLLCPDEKWQVVINYPKRKLKSLGEYEYDRHTLKYEEEEVEEEPWVYYGKVDLHPVYPLYWCNNKEFDVNGGCNICDGSNFGTHYYMCANGKMYHQECVKTTSKINHPYHPEHSLVLAFQEHKDPIIECLCCGGRANFLVYHCSICKVYMHPICAKKLISFFIEKPKRHGHPLTFFPRQTSLTCNVCGLLRSIFPTYICARCNFVAHKDCMYAPNIIKISRHPHRISYISSLQSGEWHCGVCRQSIDNNYGAYTCERCSDYAVHSRCALRKDV